MKQYKHYTLTEYLQELSQKSPVPGGGSVAALTAALGAGLISMVTNYSIGKTRNKSEEKAVRQVLQRSEKLREEFLKLVDLDAKAYLKVVKTRKSPPKIKQAALKQAQLVPLRVCQLCYQAIELTPRLVKYGNKNLMSDVQVALELLLVAFNSAMINVKVNQ